MKREIKFRGLKENGEWLYGGVLFFNDGTAIMPDGEEGEKMVTSPVKKETIGQFAGLIENNTEVYEGDIFTCDNYKMYGGKHIVKYDNELASFVFISTNPKVQSTMLCKATNITVIGNTHQNPELLSK